MKLSCNPGTRPHTLFAFDIAASGSGPGRLAIPPVAGSLCGEHGSLSLTEDGLCRSHPYRSLPKTVTRRLPQFVSLPPAGHPDAARRRRKFNEMLSIYEDFARFARWGRLWHGA
jgi:hypothetical protein